jgi:hypothetical protein
VTPVVVLRLSGSQGLDQPSVDEDVSASDVTDPITGQQHHQVGKSLRVGEAAGRRVGDGLLATSSGWLSVAWATVAAIPRSPS